MTLGSTAQVDAFAPVLRRVQSKLETAFLELDDIVVALSPDAPQNVVDAWSALHNLMTPDFIARRDAMRGLKPASPVPSPSPVGGR